jgi:hypothetical protein
LRYIRYIIFVNFAVNFQFLYFIEKVQNVGDFLVALFHFIILCAIDVASELHSYFDAGGCDQERTLIHSQEEFASWCLCRVICIYTQLLDRHWRLAKVYVIFRLKKLKKVK